MSVFIKLNLKLNVYFKFVSVLCILFLCQLFYSCGDKNKSQLPQLLSDGKYLLSNGWSLSPAGREISLGGLPLKIVIVPNTDYAVVASDGYTEHFIALIDLKTEKIIDRDTTRMGWMGLAVSNDGKHIYASAGSRNEIFVFDLENGQMTRSGEISFPAGTFPAGLYPGADDKYLYIAGNHNNQFIQVDLSTKQIVSTREVGITPYACILTPDSRTAYVSNWGENSVSVIDLTSKDEAKKIIVKDNPNDLIINSKRNHLYVACGNRNIVSVIDLTRNEVIEEIEVSLHPGAPAGSTPNALALSSDGNILYVANADNNCLAVIDVSSPDNNRPLGFIPTGWYPAAIAIPQTGGKIIVANGKGSVTHPSGDKSRGLPGESIHRILEGTLSFIDIPDKQQLDIYSDQVYENTPYMNKSKVMPSPPIELGDNCPIKYVFYIIKENRTYDQIFGDMEIGNGDTAYCYFPEEVTPNHHQLARTFTLFDNFYHNAEVSADGHFWSTAAYATDYVEKLWPSSYSRQGNPRLSFHEDSIAFPSSGFLWDLCAAKGITYRSYGEFARVWIPEGDEEYPSLELLQKPRLTWSPKDKEMGLQIRPATVSLIGHVNPEYAGSDYISAMSDSTRFEIWSKEFRQFIKEGNVPRFNVLSLPGDHLLGTRPGVQTPRAMMAENDYILGRIVEEISKSPRWKETAIFISEDDPQSGPDHVDCHRTVALVVSPYTKRDFVDNTMYSSASMLRTMEEILGLPPLTQYDASATPMWNAFKKKADLTPYTVLKNRVPLNEVNSPLAYGSQESLKLTLNQADSSPDDEYNIILWKAIKGAGRPFPPKRRAVFVRENG